jgi:excisionase family DNA binding protein
VKQPVERVAGLQVSNPLKRLRKILEGKKCMQQVSQPITKPMVMNISQVAEALGLSRGKIYQLIRDEHLPVVPFGRVMRVRPDSLELWLKNREGTAI